MIFVDTGFLFDLASNKDPDHERVREVFEEFDPDRLPEFLIPTNHVIFESPRGDPPG